MTQPNSTNRSEFAAQVDLQATPAVDVAIIGAGIIGIAHAFQACQQGKKVVVIERDSQAVGASIRNFGHACFSAQSLELQDLAMRSRAGWLKAKEQVNIWAKECGTVAIARNETELAVIEQVAQNRPGTVEMLSSDQVSKRLNGLGGNSIGGGFLPLDMRVDPRNAVSDLARFLQQQKDVSIHWQTSFKGYENTPYGIKIHTSRGEVMAERLLICVGHDLDYIAPQQATAAEIKRCRLNMVRVKNPASSAIEPAIFTSTSLTRYGAFTETSACETLAAMIAQQNPQLVDVVANVMATQLPDGTVLIGDTHHYHTAATPFMQEAHSQVVLADMANALGVSGFDIIERWQGVYANSPKQVVLRNDLDEAVQAITVTSGVGMTLSFGIAAESFAD